MEYFIRWIRWWISALLNYLLLFPVTRGFKFTDNIRDFLYFIEQVAGVKVHISGYDLHGLKLYKTSGAIICDELDRKPHIVIWPYRDEHEFMCTLAHEFGHILQIYSHPTLGFRPDRNHNTTQAIIKREEDAWASAASVLKKIFPQNQLLYYTFDRLYESSIHTYINACTLEYLLSSLLRGEKKCQTE